MDIDTTRPSPPQRKRHRLRPRHRIHSPKHFQRAYAGGSRARGTLMMVVVVPNGLEWSRMGLSVGKRIWKGAVQRNRVRRVFRESFRLSMAALPPGLDIILIPAAPRLVPGLAESREELQRLVPKALRRYRDKIGEPPQR